jgi:hypothetical protein
MIVKYLWRHSPETPLISLAAVIAWVNEDGTVNLTYLDPGGFWHTERKVKQGTTEKTWDHRTQNLKAKSLTP